MQVEEIEEENLEDPRRKEVKEELVGAIFSEENW